MRNILIADDEESARALLKSSLEMAGIIGYFVEAANGSDALNKIDKQAFSFIFIDLKMPKLDGASAIKHIKDHPNCRDAKIFVVSSHLDKKVLAQLIKDGVDQFFIKPINAEILKEKISSYL